LLLQQDRFTAANNAHTIKVIEFATLGTGQINNIPAYIKLFKPKQRLNDSRRPLYYFNIIHTVVLLSVLLI